MDPNLVILAAGLASRMKRSVASARAVDSRLRTEAATKAKAMIGVGKDGRPFLDYLLDNARQAGYRDVVIVVHEHDRSVRDYFADGSPDRLGGVAVGFAVQRTPGGRTKPLGTADALLQALLSRPDWSGKKFTVCNSDNLYTTGALEALLNTPHSAALIDYDRSALRFAKERITQFAVIDKDPDGYVRDIVEKPSSAEIQRLMDANGRVGVSMNVFRLTYGMILPFLEAVPLHPVRQEKELPIAIGLMLRKHPRSMIALPRSEHVPDLTTLADLDDVTGYLGGEPTRSTRGC